MRRYGRCYSRVLTWYSARGTRQGLLELESPYVEQQRGEQLRIRPVAAVVQVGLYFAFVGQYSVMLFIPAGMGTVLAATQAYSMATSHTLDNPYRS